MSQYTWVKVVGFGDVERHSINTLLRLSEQHNPSYALWTPEVPSAPQVALIDLDSYEGALEMESPRYNANLKHICVGSKTTSKAWRMVERPVDWGALRQEMDALFASSIDIDLDMALVDVGTAPTPPGVTVTLIVGLRKEDRLYLRARLALAGFTTMDEAESAAQATEFLGRRHYGMVIISLEITDADPWSLVRALQDMPMPVRSVVVATTAPTVAAQDMADKAGCVGMLEIPFQPSQVFALLQKV
jgi:hypothetical protein